MIDAIVAFLRGLPWQLYAAVTVIVILLAFGQYRYNEGWHDAVADQQKQQQRAKDGADKEVDRLRGGDRSRVMQFDRD